MVVSEKMSPQAATLRLVVRIMEPFWYRREMTWNREAASSDGMGRCWVGDGTPCGLAAVGFPVPALRTGRARFRASGSPRVSLGRVELF